MSFWKIILNLNAKKLKTNFDVNTLNLFVNRRIVDGWNAKTMTNTTKMINIIRNTKIKKYETIYIVRNKKAFNTLLFQINFDIIITDRFGNIIDLLNNIGNNYISKYYDDAYFILFSIVGTINFLNLKVNDNIKFEKKPRPHLWHLV